MQNQDTITFRDIPFGSWLIGLISLGAAIYFFSFQGFSGNTILFGAIGLFMLLILRGLTIKADRSTRTLRLHYWSLYFWRTTREIPFAEIETIRVDSTRSMERRGQQSSSYRIEVIRKDKSIVPFRKYYSGGFFSSMRKQKIVDQLRAFIGLDAAFDESPAGFLRAVQQATAEQAAGQQEALTGPNEQEHVTNGVHWQLQSSALGGMPATRWYSPDFKTRGGFLWLTQKMPGQPTGGILGTLSKAIFPQFISLYGFSEADFPNISQAEVLESISPRLDPHFAAFTNLRAESRQILNTWMQHPLAEWGECHPVKQFQGGMTQLLVLFGPNGVYLSVMGVLKPDQVEELTRLGVEMVKTQGTVQAR